MTPLQFLQPLAPVLSAILLATIADVVFRLFAGARDRFDPLLGVPARMASRLEAKLNRRNRPRNVRYSRGIITLAIMIVIGLVLGFGLQELSIMAQRHGWMLTPLIWFFCFRLTFPWTTGVDLAKQWKKNEKKPEKALLAEGFAILSRRRVPVLVISAKTDKFGLARMVIEATATSLHRGWLSLVLWGCVAALLGYSAIVVAVLIVTLMEAERVIATQDNANSPFVKPFETVEAVVNFVPARVAALIFVLAAFFTPGAKPFTALGLMFGQSDAHRSYNSGWPVAAVAGALAVAIQTGGKDQPWIGGKTSTAQVVAKDVMRAIWLHGVAVGLSVLIFTAVLLLSLAV